MTRTRPRREEVRADILAAATEAFERNGYAGTTLTDVAAAAGYTKGAVYSSFGGKPELFAEACSQRLERIGSDLMGRLRPVLDAGGDRDQLVERIGDALTAAAVDSPVNWQTLQNEFRAVALRDPAVDAAYQRLTQHRVAYLAELFRSQPYLARVPDDTLQTASLVLLGLVNSLALEHAAAPSQVDRATIASIFTAFLRTVLP